ncbi:MAG: type I methionyl aminopeptidase [Bdellovibrionaceae bacterium]|nr:type I methionyl aminopeptidase [Pseudobdellovibrionaceae bacterium]
MTIKTKEEIRLMERVCQLAAQTLYHTAKFIRPGVTTDELNKIADDFTLSHGARSAPLGYHGFPKSICASINDVVCHGVPGPQPLKEGDIVNLDITCLKDGFHGDTSATFFVGQVSDQAKFVTEVAKQAMEKGIEAITPNGTTGDIGFAIEKFVTRKGFHVVREIGGHGIGRDFHEDPFVPSFGKKGKGDRLMPWATITVEPMVNESAAPIIEMPIANSSVKWYVTSDRSLSAQFEHTVLITDTGYQILTQY